MCLGKLIITIRALISALTDLLLELMTFSFTRSGDEEAFVESSVERFSDVGTDKKIVRADEALWTADVYLISPMYGQVPM